jgi:hypothetical protein
MTKRALVKPSDPGLFSFFILFILAVNSALAISPSKLSLISSDNVGTSVYGISF